MQKEAPFLVIHTENNGMGTPFFVRLLLFILQLRDKLLFSTEDKLYFDNQYARFFEPAKLAYLSYRKLITLHNEYIGEFSSGAVTCAQQKAIAIEKTIDSDARSLTNTILSDADIAFKGYVNEFLNMFDGTRFGFLAQKDKTYQVEISKLRTIDNQLADYFDRNRKAWMSQMNAARNRKEHAGWRLPRYQFIYNQETGCVEMHSPSIDGMMYCWRRAFTTIKCREKRANYCRNITSQRRVNRSQQPSSRFFTLLEWSAALRPEPCPFAVRRSPASFPGSFPRAV